MPDRINRIKQVLGTGMMTLSRETWAMLCWNALQFHPNAERRGPRPSTPTGWRGWIVRALYLACYVLIVFGINRAASGLPDGPTFGLQMAGLLVGVIVLSYSRHRGADVRLLRSTGKMLRLPWLAALVLLASVTIGVVSGTDSADAHPPSEENKSTDTVPHPNAGDTILPENVISWLSSLTGSRANAACTSLAVAGLALTRIPATLPAGVTALAIGGGCYVLSNQTKFKASDLLAAVKHPLTIHPRGGGANKLSTTCVAQLSGGQNPSAAVVKACSIDLHIAKHKEFEDGPAKHAADRAAALAAAKAKLAEIVAVYQDYTGPKLVQNLAHANADVAAAQRLALELAYPNNRKPLVISHDYEEPSYTWATDDQKWRKTNTTKTLSHTLIVTGPGCPAVNVKRMVEEYYTLPVEKTRQVPYEVEEERTRQVPYTVEETRTRQVPYTVEETRSRQVPYTVQVTKYRNETYTVQVPKTRREAYQVPVTRYRTRTVTETVYKQESYQTYVVTPVQVQKTRYRTETHYRWAYGITGWYREAYTVRVPYTVTVTEYRRTAVTRTRTVPVQVTRQVTEPYISMETRYRTVSYTEAEQRTRRVPYTVTETRYRTETYKVTVTKHRTETYTVTVTKHRTEKYTVTVTKYREEKYTENVRKSRMVERLVQEERCPPHIAAARALWDQQARQEN